MLQCIIEMSKSTLISQVQWSIQSQSPSIIN